jgi:hypothetical protein
VARSSLPFRSSGGVAAKSAGDLRNMLQSLLDESSAPRTTRSLQVYSKAGARSALGALPQGFDDDAPALFAVAQVSGDTFVLVLARHGASWKAVGLVRH